MKALIIVRGGDKSLHQQWLLTPKEKRSYDVALSYFGSNPDFWKDRCDIFHHCSGSKWEGLSDFIKKYKDIFSSYDYIWLPDDDLIMHNSDVEKFFSICRKNDFIISQPSLMKYSFYSWKITLQHKLYSFRETNFVEIMAPCFKASSFSIFSKTFSENSSGWGLEWLWWELAKTISPNRRPKFAIVDEVAMLHTREVGKFGSGGAINTPATEEEDLLRKYNLKKFKPKTIYRKINIQASIKRKLARHKKIQKFFDILNIAYEESSKYHRF